MNRWEICKRSSKCSQGHWEEAMHFTICILWDVWKEDPWITYPPSIVSNTAQYRAVIKQNNPEKIKEMVFTRKNISKAEIVRQQDAA